MEYFILQWILDIFNEPTPWESSNNIVIEKPSPMRYTKDGRYIIMPDGKLKLSMQWLYKQPMDRKIVK